MESLICILTFGFDCGWVDDNRHHMNMNPPAIEIPHEPSAPVPEPGAGMLFGAGLLTLYALKGKKTD